MAICYNLISCNGFTPNILNVTDVVLAGYVNQLISYNGDPSRKYYVRETTQVAYANFHNDNFLCNDPEFIDSETTLTSLIYNGVEYVIGPLQSFNLTPANLIGLSCVGSSCVPAVCPDITNHQNTADFLNSMFVLYGVPLLATPFTPISILDIPNRAGVKISLSSGNTFSISLAGIIGITPNTWVYTLNALNEVIYDMGTGFSPYAGIIEDCPINIITINNVVVEVACPDLSYLLVECNGDFDNIYTSTDLGYHVGKVISLVGVEACWQVVEAVQIPSATIVVVDTIYEDCQECNRKCYILHECNGLLPDIKTDYDLSLLVGTYIQIESCPNNCWLILNAITCLGDVVPIKPIRIKIKTCEDCYPPIVIPIPIVLHARKVKPGYNTPGCSPEYTERINCNFADQVFNKMMVVRYGITPCCEDEYDKYLLKKEMLDLQAIYDENGCRSTCFACKPPCAVVATIQVYYPITCQAPVNVVAILTVDNAPCNPPTNVVSGVVIIYKIRGG